MSANICNIHEKDGSTGPAGAKDVHEASSVPPVDVLGKDEPAADEKYAHDTATDEKFCGDSAADEDEELPDLDAIFKKYGDAWCEERGGKCDRMNPIQPAHEDRRLLVSDGTIEFDGSPIHDKTSPHIVTRQTVFNDTPSARSDKVEFSENTANAFAWNTEGFKLSIGAKLKVGVPAVFDGVTSFTSEVDLTTRLGKTRREEKTWSVVEPVELPPMSKVEAALTVDVREYTQRFRARCVFSGSVCSNSPDPIDGDALHFHSIADIFARFPTKGFTVDDDKVHYEGDGTFTGLVGIRARVELREEPLPAATATA